MISLNGPSLQPLSNCSLQQILYFRHTNRKLDSMNSRAMKMINALDTGSGTAVMSRLQPSRVVWPPGLVSAKKSVQVLLGLAR